jgi:hypothetical protein
MSGEVQRCGGCGTTDLTEMFDMGSQPLAEGGSSRSYPLRLLRCLNCSLVQLSAVVDKETVFQPEHPYTTGNSEALRKHYQGLAWTIQPSLHAGDVIVDIGANDGTFLRSFSGHLGSPDLKLIAVEPTNQIRKPATYGNQAPLEIYQEFFTAELASRIRGKHGPAKVVTACNVLAHVPSPHDFLAGVTILLDEDDGVFITENHDLESITGGLQIDTVYHEHLRYYDVASLSYLLERHFMRVTRVTEIATHGGSLRVTARPRKPGFPGRARAAATALRAMLWKITFGGHQAVYGISAATRAAPIIHYAGIADFISVTCEVPGSDKIGSKIPGTRISVIDEAALIEDQPPYALLFNWHMADIVVPKLRERGYKGKFIVPLPEPKVLDD